MKKSILIALVAILTFSVGANAQNRKAPARKAPARKTATVAKPIKPEPIEMGFSVKWGNALMGATTARKSGQLIAVSEASNKISALGEGWRLPTMSEMKQLLSNCFVQIITSNGAPTAFKLQSLKNEATITIPIPKTCFINPSKSFVNPTQNMYLVYLLCEDGCGYVQINGVSAQKRYALTSQMNSIGLSDNINEWPIEGKEKIMGIFKNSGGFDAKLSWIAITDFVENDWSANPKMSVLPVFSINDDE